MSLTKKALAEKIKRRIGYPMVKVELDNSQLYDAIDYARAKFIKWAVGQATHEVFFTKMLSAGENFYDLPIGVTEVVSYQDDGSSSGINTLFTIENFLYNQGMFEALYRAGSSDYTVVSYHIARDFLTTLRKYTPAKYNYKYHRYTNQLEVHPAPATGNSLTLDEGTFDSPGFILIRAYMVEGASYNSLNHGGGIGTGDAWSAGDSNEDFYDTDWIFDYATAETKIILGTIRRKFENFAAIGNVGVALDGQTLVDEGKAEKEYLEETLRLEETWDGLGISIGY